MEKTIYENKYKKTTLDENLSYIANYWTAEEMTDEVFRTEIETWTELIEQHKPKNLLADTQLFTFTISVESQEWNNTVIFPRIIAAGVKKFAIIVSQEIMSQLSIEQTMETANAGALQSKHFDNVADAIEWFKS